MGLEEIDRLIEDGSVGDEGDADAEQLDFLNSIRNAPQTDPRRLERDIERFQLPGPALNAPFETDNDEQQRLARLASVTRTYRSADERRLSGQNSVRSQIASANTRIESNERTRDESARENLRNKRPRVERLIEFLKGKLAAPKQTLEMSIDSEQSPVVEKSSDALVNEAIEFAYRLMGDNRLIVDSTKQWATYFEPVLTLKLNKMNLSPLSRKALMQSFYEYCFQFEYLSGKGDYRFDNKQNVVKFIRGHYDHFIKRWS